MKKIIACLLFFYCAETQCQTTSYGETVAQTVMNLWSDTAKANLKWSYDQGVYLKGIEGVWKLTGDGKYFKYMKNCMDNYLDKNGNISAYKLDDFNIDNILLGRILLTLYNVLGDEKYYKAANNLRQQLAAQPRTQEGGFWHKKRYPNQMWLDGLYMGEPFYAEYAKLFHQDTAFNDIVHQFTWMENHTRDVKTGLLYHGWDESKKEKWSNTSTGASSQFWVALWGGMPWL